MSDSVESSILWLSFFTFLVVSLYYLLQRNRQVPIRHATYIQGIWERKGVSEAGDAWFIRYYISHKDIAVFADPPLLFQADYSILSETENLITLQLHHLQTDPPYPDDQFAAMPIAIDRKHQQILIADKIFKRV